MAHTDLSATFYLLHTAVGDVTMNKFGTCSQWRREVFTVRMLFFSAGIGTMNAPRCWQLHDDNACSDVGTSGKTLAALQRKWENLVQPLKKPTQVPPIPTAWWVSFPRGEFNSELPTAVRSDTEFLKGSHRMGMGWFFKNLCASLFKGTVQRVGSGRNWAHSIGLF
jgi:hypothetical protein